MNEFLKDWEINKPRRYFMIVVIALRAHLALLVINLTEDPSSSFSIFKQPPFRALVEVQSWQRVGFTKIVILLNEFFKLRKWAIE